MRPILTIVAVTSALVSLSTAASSFPTDDSVGHAKRQAALNWAIAQQQRAFDEILPRGTRHDVVLPVCRVVTIRPGDLSDDRREFRIRISQLCDGGIRYAEAAVARVPFAVQLARMRLGNEDLTLADALPHLEVDHRDIVPDDALRILHSLDLVRVSPNPTNALILDSVSVEIDVLSWGEVRITTFLEDKRTGWRQLGQALTDAMRLAKISAKQLQYDPREVER